MCIYSEYFYLWPAIVMNDQFCLAMLRVPLNWIHAELHSSISSILPTWLISIVEGSFCVPNLKSPAHSHGWEYWSLLIYGLTVSVQSRQRPILSWMSKVSVNWHKNLTKDVNGQCAWDWHLWPVIDVISWIHNSQHNILIHKCLFLLPLMVCSTGFPRFTGWV